MLCSHCGTSEGVQLEDSRTACAAPEITYFDFLLGEDDGLTDSDAIREALDPNKPIPLCRVCLKQHTEFWDAMWEEYYASQG